MHDKPKSRKTLDGFLEKRTKTSARNGESKPKFSPCDLSVCTATTSVEAEPEPLCTWRVNPNAYNPNLSQWSNRLRKSTYGNLLLLSVKEEKEGNVSEAATPHVGGVTFGIAHVFGFEKGSSQESPKLTSRDVTTTTTTVTTTTTTVTTTTTTTVKRGKKEIQTDEERLESSTERSSQMTNETRYCEGSSSDESLGNLSLICSSLSEDHRRDLEKTRDTQSEYPSSRNTIDSQTNIHFRNNNTLNYGLMTPIPTRTGVGINRPFQSQARNFPIKKEDNNTNSFQDYQYKTNKLNAIEEQLSKNSNEVESIRTEESDEQSRSYNEITRTTNSIDEEKKLDDHSQNCHEINRNYQDHSRKWHDDGDDGDRKQDSTTTEQSDHPNNDREEEEVVQRTERKLHSKHSAQQQQQNIVNDVANIWKSAWDGLQAQDDDRDEQETNENESGFDVNCTNNGNHWKELDGSTFEVRGPTFLKNRAKINSESSLLRLITVDLVQVSEPIMTGFSQRPGERIQKWIEQSTIPEFVFCFNGVLPGPPHYHCLIYFAIDDMKSLGITPDNNDNSPMKKSYSKLLHDFFLGPSDEFRNQRLKLMPRIMEGNFFLKTAVGRRAMIVGNNLKQTFVRGDGYLEAIVDLSSNPMTEKLLRMATGGEVIADFGFVLEGRDESSLPENVMGSVRLQKKNFNGDIRFVEA